MPFSTGFAPTSANIYILNFELPVISRSISKKSGSLGSGSPQGFVVYVSKIIKLFPLHAGGSGSTKISKLKN